MENKGKKEFSKITVENVRDIGEVIAIHAMKITMAYSGEALDELYSGLIHDVFNTKTINETYSSGYDIASEAICFLCGHIGKSLEDEFKVDKKGRVITIRTACYREVYKYIEHQRGHIYNTYPINELLDGEEPSCDFEEQQEKENDYNILESLISQMNLNKGELETLNCYMAGMGFTEMAKILAVNLSTIWRRRQQLQQKYVVAFGC